MAVLTTADLVKLGTRLGNTWALVYPDSREEPRLALSTWSDERVFVEACDAWTDACLQRIRDRPALRLLSMGLYARRTSACFAPQLRRAIRSGRWLCFNSSRLAHIGLSTRRGFWAGCAFGHDPTVYAEDIGDEIEEHIMRALP